MIKKTRSAWLALKLTEKNFMKALHPIFDYARLTDYKCNLEMLYQHSGLDERYLIKQADWITVPIESGDHFNDTDKLKLLDTLIKRGEKHIIAYAIEPLAAFPTALIVP